MNVFRRYLGFTASPETTGGLAGRGLYGLLGFLLFLALWSLLGQFIFTRPAYRQFHDMLPMPALSALGGLVGDPVFWESVLASLRRVVVGIGLAFICGVPAGLHMGFFRRIHQLANTPVQFLRMISPLSWMPIALLLFRSFEAAIYFLIAMATVWPVLLSTADAVLRVNPNWLHMARIQGATNFQLMYRIVIPASLPAMMASLRLALGVAWIVLVPVEFLGVSSGLGYLINDARDIMEYDRLMALVLAIGIIGYLLDTSLQLVQRGLQRSRFS